MWSGRRFFWSGDFTHPGVPLSSWRPRSGWLCWWTLWASLRPPARKLRSGSPAWDGWRKTGNKTLPGPGKREMRRERATFSWKNSGGIYLGESSDFIFTRRVYRATPPIAKYMTMSVKGGWTLINHDPVTPVWQCTVWSRILYLGVVSYGGRQQGEGVFDVDPPLDDLLTQAFQAVLTVRGGQVQQACSQRIHTCEKVETKCFFCFF